MPKPMSQNDLAKIAIAVKRATDPTYLNLSDELFASLGVKKAKSGARSAEDLYLQAVRNVLDQQENLISNGVPKQKSGLASVLDRIQTSASSDVVTNCVSQGDFCKKATKLRDFGAG